MCCKVTVCPCCMCLVCARAGRAQHLCHSVSNALILHGEWRRVGLSAAYVPETRAKLFFFLVFSRWENFPLSVGATHAAPLQSPSLTPSFLHSLSRSSSPPPTYLLLLLLLVLLGEEGVDPPDFGEHAAVRQAEAEAEQPQTKLARKKKGGVGGGDRGQNTRGEKLFLLKHHHSVGDVKTRF